MSSPEGSTVIFRRIPAGLRRLALERFARRLQRDVCAGRPFDCLITTDGELRRLNRDFRGKDYATDVLSFPSDPGAGGAASGTSRGGQNSTAAPLGDIAISFGRARSQAREFGHEAETEIRILMLHGVLHLLGMDHETDEGHMARAEKHWRARLRLPNGLIERAGP
jgi:probable rRNA maturation factor